MIRQASRYAAPAPTITGGMKKRIYGIWLLLSVSLGCLGANERAMGPKRPKAGIRIRVLNPASIPAGTLRKAEQLAGDVLDAAGIEITWLESWAPTNSGCTCSRTGRPGSAEMPPALPS